MTQQLISFVLKPDATGTYKITATNNLPQNGTTASDNAYDIAGAVNDGVQTAME